MALYRSPENLEKSCNVWWFPYEQIWNSVTYRSFIPSFVEIGLRFVRRFFENLTYFSTAAILDLATTSILPKMNKLHPVYYRKVWPISAKRFPRIRHLKSLVKERPFDLSAAILDDVIIWFRQKMLQTDRLVDIFDLIYYMAIYVQKLNLTPIWRLGPSPFLTQGPPYEQIWNSVNYRSFIRSFVEIGQAVCEKKIFWESDLLFNGGHVGFGDDLHFNKN